MGDGLILMLFAIIILLLGGGGGAGGRGGGGGGAPGTDIDNGSFILMTSIPSPLPQTIVFVFLHLGTSKSCFAHKQTKKSP